jgi:hypothetical protein
MEGCYMNGILTNGYYKMMFDCCFSVLSLACDSLDNGNCTVIGRGGKHYQSSFPEEQNERFGADVRAACTLYNS